MATNPIDVNSRSVTLLGEIPHVSAVTSVLSRFDRGKLAAFVMVAIDLIDVLDGDPDLEPAGDELDGTNAEDDFNLGTRRAVGAGCPLSDPDSAVDDTGCDDINDDREHEELLTMSYGIDQSNHIPAHDGLEVVVDYECGDAVKRTTPGLAFSQA